MSPEPSLEHLQAEAHHARERVTLYRRKLYAGGGTAQRLAELERIAKGADDRLRRARAAARGDGP